ncbi:MAG TPA: monovalent cation/H+ antiporter complex subunit F [Xanthobacteraceae bacterium]|jgi:multicomponent Na+:H+ antiporter subunit F
MTNSWLAASIALLPPLLLAVIASGRGPVHQRLVGIEFAAALAVLLLVALSFAFDQASSIDLALTLALLGLPGTLLFALFEERWL